MTTITNDIRNLLGDYIENYRITDIATYENGKARVTIEAKVSGRWHILSATAFNTVGIANSLKEQYLNTCSMVNAGRIQRMVLGLFL